MRNRTIQQIGIILFLFISISAIANVNDYHDADAVFLEVHKTYTLNPDGSMRIAYHHRIKLLTTFAVSRLYGETFIVTNPEFQTLTVDRSETTMADGNILSSPENAFNEVLPRVVHNAPAYAYLREMVITHTGLERGAVIDLQYHIDTKADFVPWLMGEEIFGDRCPIEKMTVTIRVPSETQLKYHLYNGLAEPEIKKGENGDTYIWTMTNIQLIPSEANHPDFAEFTPRLIFSTCSDWKTLSAYLSKQFSGNVSVGDKIREVLLSGISENNDKTKVLAIRNCVADQLDDVHLDPNVLGFRASAPDLTFDRNYGTGLDKALLLRALLASEGFHSTIGLVSTHCQFSPSIQSLHQFNRACVFAEMEDDEVMILLPDGDQQKTGQQELAGHVLFLPDENEPVLMQVDETGSESNYLKVKATLVLDENLDLTGDVFVQTGGCCHEGYNLTSGKKQTDFMDDILDCIFGEADVTDINTLSQSSEKGRYSVSITAGHSLKPIGNSDLLIYQGAGSLLDTWDLSAALFERATPIQLSSAFSEYIEISLALSKNIQVVSQPDQFNLTNDAGHLMWKRKIEGNVLTIERQLVIPKKTIQPVDYSDFRELIVNLEADDANHVFFHRQQ